MKVIIPLAGKGTRLRPHTHVTPKPMLRIAGKPVIDYVMEDLQKLGNVEQVVYITGHLKEKVEELGIEIGLITTPPERAQRAANYLVDAGIRGIINFAPARINVPEEIYVEYVDFFHHLYAVAFNLTLDRKSE